MASQPKVWRWTVWPDNFEIVFDCRFVAEIAEKTCSGQQLQ
jgi:hypothetical protein